MEKLPPIEKIYEAWTAIADGRIHFNESTDGNEATVTSSDGNRTYTVTHSPEMNTYSSDDNATVWQGYPGYPIIAMMMIQRVVPFDRDWAMKWKGVNWHNLNERYNRNYDAVVAAVEHKLGINPMEARRRAQAVINALAVMPARVRRLRAEKV